MGKVATQPLLPRGSPPLLRGWQNQKWPTCSQGGYATSAASEIPTHRSGGLYEKWPTCGQGGYVTLAASGIPTASERGAESEVAHLWARWLHNPWRHGDLYRFRAGGTIRSGPVVGMLATPRGSPGAQFTAFHAQMGFGFWVQML